VRALHERAILAAVRDTLTVDKLARIGVNATCAGCPVTFLTDRAVTATEASDGPLIVSMPPTRLLRRWLGRRYVRSVMRYVTWLRDRDDTDVLVTLHDARDVDPARSLVPDGVPTFYSDDLDALIDRVERSRGVVGFRLHAALLGLALGKPVVPVALDWRGEAFIRTTALDACGVRALRTGQAAKLRTLTDRLLSSDPALLTQLIDAKTALAARYDAALTDGVTALRALGNGW